MTQSTTGHDDVSNQLTVVLAGTYRDFKYWCQLNKVNPNSRYVLYASKQNIRGLCFCEACTKVVRCANFWYHIDQLEIDVYIKNHQRLGHYYYG